MITLIFVLAILAIAIILVLALTGIVAIAWPVLLILVVGAIIDGLMLKLIFGKKKEK